MVNPVPGRSVTTAYKKTGEHWTACGYHTGQDYAADYGDPVVAARSGTVAHVDYGPAFGGHQFAIRPGDGTEDFYAHCGSRPAHGSWVDAGQQVAICDAEGNATGTHLHFERHKWFGWDCDCFDDPMKSHNAAAGETGAEYPPPTSRTVYLSKLKYGQRDSDSVWYLQDTLNRHSIPGGQTLPTTAYYGSQTDEEVRLCQRHHLPPEDPLNASFVGEQQAVHIFGDTDLIVVNDL